MQVWQCLILSFAVTWKQGRLPYLTPAECKKWAFYALTEKQIHFPIETAAKRIYDEASSRGIRMPEPTISDYLIPDDLEKMFEDHAIKGFDFILFAMSDTLNLQGVLLSILLVYPVKDVLILSLLY